MKPSAGCFFLLAKGVPAFAIAARVLWRWARIDGEIDGTE